MELGASTGDFIEIRGGLQATDEVIYQGKNLLELAPEERACEGVFLAFQYPTEIPGVDTKYVNPRASWDDVAAYDEQAGKLATLFEQNIGNFDVSREIVAAGPKAG